MRETMTPRERWLAVLARKKPDRTPMDYWGTEEATAKLLKHLGCSTLWEAIERLHIDRIVGVSPDYVGPPPKTNLTKKTVTTEERRLRGDWEQRPGYPRLL